ICDDQRRTVASPETGENAHAEPLVPPLTQGRRAPTPFERIWRNAAAHGFGIGCTVLVQLVTFPVLLAVWSQEMVGAWILIMTVPAYLALSDLGFASAATAKMTAAFAHEDRNRLAQIFQSLLVLVLLLAACLTGASTLLILVVATFFTGTAPWLAEFVPPLLLMVAYSGLQMLTRVPVAAMRASNQYGTATVAADTMWTIEGLGVITIAALGGALAECAFGYAAFRLGCLIALVVLQKARLPWLKYNMSFFSWSEVRDLMRPTLAGAALPVSVVLAVQGMTLVAGGVLGAAAVAVLVPIRTATRFPVQALAIFSRGSMPEVSRAHAMKTTEDLLRIVRTNALIALGILAPTLVAFAFWGQWLVSAWTLGRIEPDHNLVVLLAAAAFLHAVWFYSANYLLATNAHIHLAKWTVGIVILTVLTSIVTTEQWGLVGLAATAAAGEAIIASIAVHHLLSALSRHQQ
ncbi:MAG: lipopolysaccharide biosynthesis protein, partial [Haliea sp.]